jgi:serine/threonine protein kinase
MLRPKGEYCDVVFTEEVLGKGGFGEVRRGTYKGQEVALKTICFSKDRTYSTVGVCEPQEIDVLSRLQHPNLLHAIDVLTPDQCPYIPEDAVVLVLPIASNNLDEYLGKALTFRQRLFLAHQVISGLHYLHSQNIIHRDISDGNVLIMDDRAVLSDFGVSKYLFDRETVTSSSLYYKIPYRPPEVYWVILRTQTVAVDIWALGCVLCHIFGSPSPIEVEGSYIREAAIHNALYIDIRTGKTSDEKSQRDFQDMTESIRNTLRKLINEGTFENILRDKIRRTVVQKHLEDVVKLIMLCLAFNPKNRADTSDLLQLSLFGDYKLEYQDGVTTVALPDGNLNNVEAEIAAEMSDYLLTIAVEQDLYLPVPFLAADLLYRCFELFENRYVAYNLMVACLIFARRLVEGRYILDLEDFLEGITDLRGFENSKPDLPLVRSQMSRVVYHLRGTLFRPYLFSALKKSNKLVRLETILTKEPQQYLNFDVIAFGRRAEVGFEVPKNKRFSEYLATTSSGRFGVIRE